MSASQDVSRFRSQRRSQGRTISKLIPAEPQISVNSAVNKQSGIVQTDYESEENLTCKVAPLINDVGDERTDCPHNEALLSESNYVEPRVKCH